MSSDLKKKFIIAFFVIILLPTLLWSVYEFISVLNPKIEKVVEVDLNENRKLKEFPATFSNAIGSEIDAYYNDNLPFRSKIILWNRGLEKFLSTPFNKCKNFFASILYSVNLEDETGEEAIPLTQEEIFYNEYIGDIDYVKYPFLKNDIITNVSKEYLEPQIVNKYTIIGRHNWLFYNGDNYIDYYLKKNVLQASEMDKFVNLLKKLKAECEKQGKQLVVVVPPNKSQIYEEFMPTYDVPDGPNRLEVLRSYIATSSDINFIYPREELKQAKKYFNGYKRYDTHYNEAGGYIVAKRVSKELENINLPPVASCSVTKLSDSLYDLVSVGNLNREDYNDEYEYNLGFENYYPHITYSVEGDTKVNPYIHIISGAPDERKLCVVGDSYRFYIANPLSHMFKETYVVYRDQMGGMQSSKEAIKKSDIIIFEVLERFSEYLILHGETLLYILNGAV